MNQMNSLFAIISPDSSSPTSNLKTKDKNWSPKKKPRLETNGDAVEDLTLAAPDLKQDRPTEHVLFYVSDENVFNRCLYLCGIDPKRLNIRTMKY
jgi:hypothetical protein